MDIQADQVPFTELQLAVAVELLVEDFAEASGVPVNDAWGMVESVCKDHLT